MSQANSSDMRRTDRRRYKRIETSNLVSYIFLDKEGNEIEEGVGTALNISQGGLLLETYIPVKARYILIMHVDLESELLTIKGKVVHSRSGESGNFFVGVRFTDTHESQRKIIVSFIKAYFSGRKRSAPKRNIP